MVLDTYMSYTDGHILPVLEALQKEGRCATIKEISESCGVPFGTVKDRLNVLERQKRIVRRGPGRRWGSLYEVVRNDTTDS